MKKYREYMNGVRVSDTLHQRLLGLEASGKRSGAWKRYGTMAAALVLVCGLGAWGLGKSGGWDALAANFRPDATLAPEIADEPAPDIALVAPGDVTEPGEKTIGGYEVVSGSGENAIVSYYVLPYIDYGGLKPSAASSTQVAADWDIPQGAVRRDLTWDEIITLMGGEDAVNTHLDWGMYALTGWAAWYEDGSFWGAYINGLLPNYDGPTSEFEFAVTAGQLPPTCVIYSAAVPQDVRGLTVTAEGHDSVAGPEGGVDASTRRVSFMKDGYGYRFDITGSSRAQTEERVSRLVCHVADRGLGLYSVDGTADVCRPEDGTYVCTYCGHVFPIGTAHNHAFIGADATYTCDLCGNTFPVGTAHTRPYDPSMCAGYPVPEGGYTCPDCGQTIPAGDEHYHTQDEPPTLRVLCAERFVDSRSGNYQWSYPGEDGQTVGVTACGFHPLDSLLEHAGLTTAEGTVALNFSSLPDRVSVVCWPDSEWGNTSAVAQPAQASWNEQTQGYELTLKEGGWIYAVTAGWDDQGTAEYVFYLVKN